MGFFRELIRRIRARRATKFKYGWDGKCKGCGAWHHASNKALCVACTPDSWIYLCACGEFTRWFLCAPCPIREDSDNG